jgi:hypothetical protein
MAPMAILLYFEKVREDDATVGYRFGYPEMDRRLVIDKESQEGTPLEGSPDTPYWAVLTKICRLYRAQKGWPDSGVYAA